MRRPYADADADADDWLRVKQQAVQNSCAACADYPPDEAKREHLIRPDQCVFGLPGPQPRGDVEALLVVRRSAAGAAELLPGRRRRLQVCDGRGWRRPDGRVALSIGKCSRNPYIYRRWVSRRCTIRSSA